MKKDLIYWSMIYKIIGMKGTEILTKLIPEIKGEAFWSLSRNEIKEKFPFIADRYLDKFIIGRNTFDIDGYFRTIEDLKVEIISFLDNIYPKTLKNLAYPPPILHCRGSLDERKLSISIVGARKSTVYGRKIAKKMAERLSQSNVLVISGMARGVDTFAHEGALKGSGGTIAVLGSGIDVIYPRENKTLYREIIESSKGLVISEFPLGAKPMPYHFPMRNRIIAALADGVLVTEASEKSGSLITVEQALFLGKDIFAIPGPITSPLSKGCNKIIKEGAKLVDSVEDVLEEYGQLDFFEYEDDLTDKYKNLNKLEKQILKNIEIKPLSAEEINVSMRIPFNKLLASLSILEIKGYVRQLPGRKFFTIN